MADDSPHEIKFPIPILRWSDGSTLKRVLSSPISVAFQLDVPPNAERRTNVHVLTFYAELGPDGWPVLPFSARLPKWDSAVVWRDVEEGDLPNQVVAWAAERALCERTHDAASATRLLDRSTSYLLNRDVSGRYAWVDQSVGDVQVYQVLQGMYSFARDPVGPATWSWADDRLADDEVQALLGLPGPALLPYDELAALLG